MLISGVDAEMKRMKAELKAFEMKAVEETKRAARVLMAELFAHTPVWEGTVVRNYVWFAGGGGGGGEKQALGSGDPGPTNDMSMGSEPRRGANESAARADMDAFLSTLKKLTTISVTNTAGHFDLVDSGSAPTGDRARNP